MTDLENVHQAMAKHANNSSELDLMNQGLSEAVEEGIVLNALCLAHALAYGRFSQWLTDTGRTGEKYQWYLQEGAKIRKREDREIYNKRIEISNWAASTAAKEVPTHLAPKFIAGWIICTTTNQIKKSLALG